MDNATGYSQIADLKKGGFYFYQHHNFNQEVKIDLSEELKKGAHRITIKSLFPASTSEKMEPVASEQWAGAAMELKGI